MSLCLVPEYASSASDSGSEREDEKSRRRQASPSPATVELPRAPPPASRELGAKLASILPSPKGNSDTKLGNKVRIMVDLSTHSALGQRTGVGSSEDSSSAAKSFEVQRPASSMFSQLSSILPAPKNARASTLDTKRPKGDGVVLAKPQTQAAQPMVPHSLTNKRKRPAASVKDKGVNECTTAAQDDKECDENVNDSEDVVDGAARLQPEGESLAPFFTIDAAEFETGDASKPCTTEDPELLDDSSDRNRHDNSQTQQGSLEAELHYDPSSGYYYSYTSGLYYYYDADNGTYVDAQTLHPADDQPAASQSIDQSGLRQLLERGAIKRGDMQAIAGASIKDVSQSTQLQGSGYSDSKAALDFVVKQTWQQRHQESKHIIGADGIDKKKKSKNNIMYLAFQAQEQDTKLKEAHANRQRAKKAARAKYGY
ncbi:hypothetical protein GGI02_002789 [Coemansia sp. RSA 2322]|nr:hypothetical protein GGI02_002789 [Coemansia sp. RSA 2322]